MLNLEKQLHFNFTEYVFLQWDLYVATRYLLLLLHFYQGWYQASATRYIWVSIVTIYVLHLIKNKWEAVNSLLIEDPRQSPSLPNSKAPQPPHLLKIFGVFYHCHNTGTFNISFCYSSCSLKLLLQDTVGKSSSVGD